MRTMDDPAHKVVGASEKLIVRRRVVIIIFFLNLFFCFNTSQFIVACCASVRKIIGPTVYMSDKFQWANIDLYYDNLSDCSTT